MLAEDGEASPDILPYEMVASVITHTIAGKPEELHIDLNALPVYVARTGQHIQCLSLKGDITYVMFAFTVQTVEEWSRYSKKSLPESRLGDSGRRLVQCTLLYCAFIPNEQ